MPRILLLPIGGMAEFDHIPRKPAHELLITAAGPAVNFVLAALLFAASWRGLSPATEIPLYSAASILDELWLWNLVMGIFNLLPVFPMDGGRVLRALLAFRLPYLRATWWAAVVSKILAPTLAGIAFFYLHQPMLGVLFLFILFVGDSEYKQTLRRDEEERCWAEMARRATLVEPDPPRNEPPPLILHGPN